MSVRHWLSSKVVNHYATTGHARPRWLTVQPGTGVRPQMVLEIVDKCDGSPLGRVYLHPDRMREFCRWGIETADEYMAEWERFEGATE